MYFNILHLCIFLVSCWLSVEDGFIWSFVGPVLLVCVVRLMYLKTTTRKIVEPYTEVLTNPFSRSSLFDIYNCKTVFVLLAYSIPHYRLSFQVESDTEFIFAVVILGEYWVFRNDF